MNDLISRQAALKAVGVNSWAGFRINALPSAQPNLQPTCNQLATDCISRQAAIDRINKQREHLQPDIYPQDKIGDAAYRICAEFIERLPSAQRTGRWIPVAGRMGKEVQCDCCGEVFWYWLTNFTYCPNCGADMRGEQG